jgi:hypothetical protein
MRERVPLLLQGLRGRGVVVTVEGEGFGIAVSEKVSVSLKMESRIFGEMAVSKDGTENAYLRISMLCQLPDMSPYLYSVPRLASETRTDLTVMVNGALL